MKKHARIFYTSNSKQGKELIFGRRKPEAEDDFVRGYNEVAQRLFDEDADETSLLDDIFLGMQSDGMNSSMLLHMRSLAEDGLISHTSMSVGDIVVVSDCEPTPFRVWYCDNVGWKDITDVRAKAFGYYKWVED